MFSSKSEREFINSRTGKIYDSFFEAARDCEVSFVDVNQTAIADYLIHGYYYRLETPLKHITKRFENKDYVIPQEHSELTYTNIDSAVDYFIDTFGIIADKIKEKSISVDITGGTDSRLVIALLKYHKVPFEGFYSLISGDENELKIVKKISTHLNSKLYTLLPGQDHNLQELVRLSDGLIDINSIKSLVGALKIRKRKGFDLTITGVAGELYKDFWWQQDFPFYGLKKSNLDRLVKSRMYPVYIPDDLFIDGYINYSNRIEKLVDTLDNYTLDDNTSTYDNIYLNFRIKEQISLFNQISDNFTPSYSPLLENKFLSVSAQLPPSIRWLNQFHRKVISKIDPVLASFPTTEGGMTLSNRTFDCLSDLSKYTLTKSGKVFSRFFNSNANARSNVGYDSIELDESMEYLSKIGLFNNIELEKISSSKLRSRIISLNRHLRKVLDE